jgi:hypothetical protein
MHVLLQAIAKDIIKRESSNMTYQVSGSNTYMILRLTWLGVSSIYGFLVPKYMTEKEANEHQ